MRSNFSPFLVLLTIFFNFYSTFCDRRVGNQLFDLEGTNDAFIAQAEEWTATNLVPNATIYSVCGTGYLLGGYNTLGLLGSSFQEGEYFSRSFTSLPSHNVIIVDLIFYKIDSWDWDQPDHASFDFDGVSLDQDWHLTLDQDYEQALCGISYKEYPNLKITMYVPHTGSSLTMKVISGLNQDSADESFGIREITMTFINSPHTTAVICDSSSVTVPATGCPCPFYNQYQDSDGVCHDCDSSCETCNGSDSNSCLSCPVDKYVNNLNQCVDCSETCVSCLGTSTYCVTCQSGYFQYDDHTCLTTCGYPLIQSSPGGVDLCTSPCSDSDYVFPNRSCASSCDPLLEPVTVGPYLLCKFPCDTDQVLYYTGECDSTCSLPLTLRSYGSYMVCDYICAADQYLYPDGTCKSSCNPPYKPSITNGKKFCVYYCNSPQYYYSPTSSCVATCPSHYYADESTMTCQACMDNNCLTCPLNAGQTCTQCQDSAILDILDSSCKVCSSMKVTYVDIVGSNGHQYSLKLTPASCLLDVQTVQELLTGTTSTNQIFFPYSIQVHQTGSNTFQVNMTFQQSISKQTNFEFSLSYLLASAPVPKTFLPDSAVQALAEYAPAMQTLITSATSSTMGAALAFGAMAMLWPLLNFQQFIGYFKYINVGYPLQAELFYSLFSFASFSFVPNPLAPFTDNLADEILQSQDVDLLRTYQPSTKFVKFDVTSFFIENGANALFTNLGLFIVLGLTSLIVKYYRGSIPFARPLHFSLRWNGILRTFLENGIPLSFATLLQFRRLSFDNTYTALCGFLAIVSFIYIIIMIRFMLTIITDRIRPPKNQREKIVTAQNYGTLYESLSPENPLAKYYHLFVFMRGLLLIFLIVFVETHPMLQVIPMIVVNLILVIFLFKYKLFENTVLNVISKIREILIAVGEAFILLLCFDYSSEKYPQVFAWMIIASLGTAMIVELVNIIVNQIKEVKVQFRKIKFFSQVFIFNSYEKWKLKKSEGQRKLSNMSTDLSRSGRTRSRSVYKIT